MPKRAPKSAPAPLPDVPMAEPVSPAIAPPAPRPSAAGLVRCVVDGNLVKPGRCPVCGTAAK